MEPNKHQDETDPAGNGVISLAEKKSAPGSLPGDQTVPFLPWEVLNRVVDLSEPKDRLAWYATCRHTRTMVLRIGHFAPKWNIEDKDYLNLARSYGRFLTSLEIYTRGHLMVEISQICPNLKTLNFSYRKEMDVIEFEKLTTNLKGITAIDLFCTEVVRDGSNWDDDDRYLPISAICRNCPHLLSLKFSTNNTTTEHLAELSRSCKKLRSLAFNHFPMPEFPSSFSELRELDLSGMSELTSRNLIDLLKKYPGLTKLDLRACSLLAPSLGEMSMHCPNMTFLDLSQMYKELTPETLTVVVQNCPKLQELIVEDCYQITPEVIEGIKRENPHLNITGSKIPYQEHELAG